MTPAEDRSDAPRIGLSDWLVLVGVLVACGSPWVFASTSWQRAGVLAGGAVALASLVVARGGPRLAERGLDLRRRVVRRKAHRIEARGRALGQELRALSERLSRREQELARKLFNVYTAGQYPEPLDFAQEPLTSAESSSARLTELVEKDRLVEAEIERESAFLFEKIRRNEYVVDGVFEPRLAGQDLFAFARRIALVYRPESEHPLLETNLNQVLQAASRACIHMLVVLDTLPIDAKDYNLQSTYRFVRRGVRAFDTYKSASPYIDSALHAGRIGRWALGANPLLLGTSWAVGALAKKGASSLATRYVNRQGLQFLHDLVRVVAHEVAAIYGARFRHRDPNWIYGAELTALAKRLPLALGGLERALREIDALRLRNEYDRVYLFRMLAEHKSARPERYTPTVLLSAGERRAIADRLEAFASEPATHAADAEAVSAWARSVEERLGVKLRAGRTDAAPGGPTGKPTGGPTGTEADPSAEPGPPSPDAYASALASLASFLIDQHGFETEAVARRLAGVRCARAWQLDPSEAGAPGAPGEDRFARIAREASPYFEPPDLSIPRPVTEDYLRDLVDLWLVPPPPDAGAPGRARERSTAQFVRDVGACLAHPPEETRRIVDAACRDELARRTQGPWRPVGLAPSVGCALLPLLARDERLRRVYGGAELVAPGPAAVGDDAGTSAGGASQARSESAWLALTDRRLFAFETAPIPRIVWEAEGALRVTSTSGPLRRGLELSGGIWREAPAGAARASLAPPVVRIARARFRAQRVLEPIRAFVQGRGAGSPPSGDAP